VSYVLDLLKVNKGGNMNSAYAWIGRAKSSIGWGVALLILGVVVSTAAAQPKEVLVYQFDPSTDSTTKENGITDRSGNGYNGTCSTYFTYPGAMKIVPGHLSTTFALATAGLDDFPTSTLWTGASTTQLGINQTATTDGSFTMMAWVYRNNLRHGDQMVFGTTGDRDTGYALHLGFRNYDIHFGTWTGDSDAVMMPTPPAGAWHHMAWRYTASTQTQDIILDGVVANTATNPPFEAGVQIFLIGGAFPGINGDNGAFAGLIEYPRVFNVALRNDKVAAAAKDQPIPP
jgi:hypothetical protein